MMPERLRQTVELFTSLSEEERRENLIAFAGQAGRCAPREGETFTLEDVRKDEECTDTVGIFLRLEPAGGVTFRVTLGEKVQTLTRAMTTILCRSLQGCTLEEVIDLPDDFVPRIVGGQLVRIRSQTVYYVLGRMKRACQILRNRLRAAAH
jgi:cysteine desulfuration protein SufE